MKKAVIFFLVPLSVFALDNGVRITNNYTGALTSHPIWFGRWIKQGEILNYPKPYLTPSDTLTRAAATTWQADVKNRWRDATVARDITSARIGSPTWTSGVNLTGVGLSGGVATVTFPNDHGLSVGDRLSVTNTPATAPAVENAVIYEVTSTKIVKYLNRTIVSGTYQLTGTFPSGGNVVTVTAKIDPMEDTFVCRYYSANHGFLRGETVTVAGVGSGVSGCNGTVLISGVTRNEFVGSLSGTGNTTPTVQSGATATGPDNGSVRFALISFIGTVPSSGWLYADFVNDTNPSSAGDAAATATAGYDKTEMLAATWNADIDATADVKSGSTATITISPRTMLTAWDGTERYCGPRYWARGPALTWLILESECASGTNAYTDYDFGWKIRAGTTFSLAIDASQTKIPVASVANIDVGTRVYAWTTDYVYEIMTVTAINPSTVTCNVLNDLSPAGPCLTVTRGTAGTVHAQASGRALGIFQWEDASSQWYKSLHPVFDLKFSSGWAGVGERFSVRNEYDWKVQNLWYGMTLKTGATPTARATFAEFKHPNSTSWKFDTWDGADPEFYCATSGSDPENCGGGTRTRKYFINHNTPYLEYAKALHEYKFMTGVSLGTFATGFAGSDKGRIIPGGTLGGGTYQNLDTASGATTPEYTFANGQEGYLFPAIQVRCFHLWSASCYEINFGDSNPGGGGNVETQRHIPWNHLEDDSTTPRIYMPGFSELAFGRRISIYGRPTYASSLASSGNTSAFDKPRTACASGAAPAVALSGSAASPTVATGATGWPCWLFNSVGNDGWVIKDTHANDWNEFAYLIMGDYRYLDTLIASASWYTGQSVTSRGIGHSWNNPDSSQTAATPEEVRAQGNWTRATLNAAVFTPNVPMFGDTVVPVEAVYWNEKLWDLGLAKEGFFGITDGYMAQMYPVTFDSSCAGVYNKFSVWHQTRCVNALGIPNPMGWFGTHEHGGSCSTVETNYAWANACTGGYDIIGMWYYHHSSVQWARAENLGLMPFYYNRRNWANTSFALWGSANWNPYMNDLYHAPSRGAVAAAPVGGTSQHIFVTTIADLYAGLKTTWSGGSKANETWFHDSARPGWGVDPDGYVNQWRADVATMAGLGASTRDGCTSSAKSRAGCTFNYTWDWLNKAISRQDGYSNNPKYIIDARANVTDLVCTPGGATAICTYTAPTPDICTYRNSLSAPADTLDSSDVLDGGGPKARRVVLTSLAPSNAYYFRLTCGQRLSSSPFAIATGTTRTSTTFTQVTEGSGTTLDLNLGATPAGATTATVAYGDTSAVSGGTVGPTTCTSGCTMSLPGTSKKVLYYKITYKNGGGTTIASSLPYPIMIP